MTELAVASTNGRAPTPPAVVVEDLVVRYRTPYADFEERPKRRWTGKLPVGRVEALRGVSFEVQPGTVLGVIGRNGAGKSTLMRAVAGILPPARGRVTVRGRISTMLSNGLGFNGMLTGRENIILGGLAVGMSRAQIQALAPEIEEFADLGKFIDYPLKTYSSGMSSRLAFAVSSLVEADVLLVDEGLAAGDGSFKEKCLNRINAIISSGRTVLLVSHSLLVIAELCQQCLWLDEGKLVAMGDPEEVIEAYMRAARIERTMMSLDDI